MLRRSAWMMVLALVLAVAFLHSPVVRPGRAQGNTLEVTSLADAGPGSLRQAIATAGAGDRITFAITGTILLASSLVVSRDLTVEGGGAIVLDGQDKTGILEHRSGTLTLRGLQFRRGRGENDLQGGAIRQLGGDLGLDTCRFIGNRGSAIYHQGGLMSLTDCVLAGNKGSSGGAILSEVPYGQTHVLITLVRCAIEQNWVTGDGGGIKSNSKLIIRDSQIRDNEADSVGGGLDVEAPLHISRSVLAGNHASFAGAAAFVGDTVMDNCLIAENVIDAASDFGGAAALFSSGRVRLIHCSIVGNMVPGSTVGAGIFQIGPAEGNVTGQTLLLGSLIIGNTPLNCSGGVSDGGGNLQYPGDSCGEQIPQRAVAFEVQRDPSGQLSALVPQANSAAVDSAPDSSCFTEPVLAVDARGRARPSSQRPGGKAACDIGAFESGSPVTPTPGYRPPATATLEPPDLIAYPWSRSEDWDPCSNTGPLVVRVIAANRGMSAADATVMEVRGERYPVRALKAGQSLEVAVLPSKDFDDYYAIDPENRVKEVMENNNSDQDLTIGIFSTVLTCTPTPTLRSGPTRTPSPIPSATPLAWGLPDAYFQDVTWSRECQTGLRQVQPCLSTRGPAAAAAYRVVSEPPGLSWDIDPAVAACGEPRLAPVGLTALRIDPKNLIRERSETNNRRGVPPPDFPPSSACTATPTATVPPSATPSMTPTPSDTPTRRPTATRSPTRTRTPSPTASRSWNRRLILPWLERAP